jgi:hypothetical protein
MMQHGTGREYVYDIVENVRAVLVREREQYGRPLLDIIKGLDDAMEALNDPHNLDDAGRYGPDHCAQAAKANSLRPATRQEGLDSGPFQGSNPTGRITRDELDDEYDGPPLRGESPNNPFHLE